jgi:hypothetical protein
MKAPRKKFIIAGAILLAAAIAVFAAQPIRDTVYFPFLSSTEKKVVGQWRHSTIGPPVVMTIHADHTWTSTGGCLEPPPTIHGHWRIENSYVVFDYDAGQFPADYHADPQRRAIQELIDTDREVRSRESEKK